MSTAKQRVGPATQAVLDDGIDPLTPQSARASLLATLAQLHPSRLRRTPPLPLEVRAPLEYVQLLRDQVWASADALALGGRPVALIPGFLAGDASLGPLTDWLRRSDCRTSSAGIRFNVSCSTVLIDRIERRIELLAERTGRRVVVVGQSRGGVLARGVAVRRPDLIEAIVTLGSPHIDPLAIHPLVLLQVVAVGALGSAGLPGFFGSTCFNGECCERFREEALGPFPDDVRFVSAYSKTDGVVDWRSCVAEGAENVEVGGTHFGMALNPAAYRTLAGVLQDLEAPEPRRRAAAAAA